MKTRSNHYHHGVSPITFTPLSVNGDLPRLRSQPAARIDRHPLGKVVLALCTELIGMIVANVVLTRKERHPENLRHPCLRNAPLAFDRRKDKVADFGTWSGPLNRRTRSPT